MGKVLCYANKDSKLKLTLLTIDSLEINLRLSGALMVMHMYFVL